MLELPSRFVLMLELASVSLTVGTNTPRLVGYVRWRWPGTRPRMRCLSDEHHPAGQQGRRGITAGGVEAAGGSPTPTPTRRIVQFPARQHVKCAILSPRSNHTAAGQQRGYMVRACGVKAARSCPSPARRPKNCAGIDQTFLAALPLPRRERYHIADRKKYNEQKRTPKETRPSGRVNLFFHSGLLFVFSLRSGFTSSGGSFIGSHMAVCEVAIASGLASPKAWQTSAALKLRSIGFSAILLPPDRKGRTLKETGDRGQRRLFTHLVVILSRCNSRCFSAKLVGVTPRRANSGI